MIAPARHLRFLRLLTALSFLLVLPFLSGLPHTSALGMDHEHTTGVSCATVCARTSTMPLQQAILDQNEVRTPDPIPYDIAPYYAQFNYIAIPKVIRPSTTFGALPLRPPDPTKLYVNFRF